jgi:hypothetical protein
MSWEDCRYQCECGVAYSNSQDPATRQRIVRSPALNVPVEARSERLPEVLRAALNEINRDSKWHMFCHQTSEDAVTWTAFYLLQRAGQLRLVADVAGLPLERAEEPALLLWGVPVQPSPAGSRAHERLIEICERLGESRQRRSEPDVILVWPDLVVVIEVKHTSPNDCAKREKPFDRYFDQHLFAAPLPEVVQLGYYELVRNWRIGAELAGERRFALVNLGSSAVLGDAARFAAQLGQTDRRRFLQVTWAQLLDAAEPLVPSLAAFAAERELRR